MDPARLHEAVRAALAGLAQPERPGFRELWSTGAGFFTALPLAARVVLAASAVGLVFAALRVVRQPRSPLRELLPVAAGLGAVIAAGFGLAALRPAPAPSTIFHAGSSRDGSERGARGLYRLLGSLGIPVERVDRAWPPPASVKVLVVLSPEEAPMPAELRALADWVARGGTVVLGLGSGPFGDTFGLADVFGADLREVEVYGRVRARPVGRDYEVETAAGRVLVAPGWQPVLESDRGPLCAGKASGAGRVVACAGSFLFSNAGLETADDARLAVELLRGGAVGFDEHHHGARSGAERLAKSPLGWSLVQAGAAAVLWVLAAAHARSPWFAAAIGLCAIVMGVGWPRLALALDGAAVLALAVRWRLAC